MGVRAALPDAQAVLLLLAPLLSGGSPSSVLQSPKVAPKQAQRSHRVFLGGGAGDWGGEEGT